MGARTDQHRPTELVTEDYAYRFAFDGAPSSDGRGTSEHARQLLARAVAAAATSTVDRGISQCHHCGAHIRYGAVLHHAPSGTSIIVGETCLDNRFSLASADFQALRRQAELDRAAQRIRTAREAFTDANPDLAWLAAKVTPEPHASNDFLVDVARRFRQYGELSERQVTAVRNAVARDAERAAQRAQEATEPHVGVPTGRQTVTGTIVATKWQDSDYGGSLKMLVRVETAAGSFRLWGSVPTKLDAHAGDAVTFKATLERSDREESFGYFKRPTLVAGKPHAAGGTEY